MNNLIKEFEGLKLTAYLCPAQKWTIGYGSTMHPNGIKVKQGDSITKAQAEDYLEIEIARRLTAMQLPDELTANQREALVSLQYNIGMANFAKSTLLKKVIRNENDPTIADEFMKWNKAGGKVLAGLTRRRKAEAALYFKK